MTKEQFSISNEEKSYKLISRWALAAIITVFLIPSYHWLYGFHWKNLIASVAFYDASRIGPWTLLSFPFIFAEDFSGGHDWWPLLMLLSGFIPALIIRNGCKNRNKNRVLVGAVAGICGLLVALIGVIMDTGMVYYPENPLKIVFDLEDGSVSYGFWITLIIFVICLINISHIQKREE